MKKRKLKKGALVSAILFILGIILILLFFIYNFFTGPVDKNNTKNIRVTIETGTSTRKIANILKEKDLIRSEFFFSLFVTINNKSNLKADTYLFNKSMDLDTITDMLDKGSNYDPDAINLTFLEGDTFNNYALVIAKYTNNTYDDVVNTCRDSVYLNELIDKYWFLTDAITNSNIYYPLEGYLAPNTYQFENKDVTVKEIINKLLDQTLNELDSYKSVVDASNVTIHEYITMASIVELEGTNTTNRKMIVGVFNNRLLKSMNLGSDVTTYYALRKEMTSDLTTAEFNTSNPYNTRGPGMVGKLPIGPICNPSKSSLEAAFNPTNNDYLFFVADKNGKIYYTKTNQEHVKQVQEIKDAGNWIW